MVFEMAIERGKIREFARAAKSTNNSYAGANAIVPPTFLTVGRLSWQPADQSILTELDFDLRRVLHAEEEFIFHGPPPRAGAVLSAKSSVTDVYEKEGRRGGRLRFGSVRTEFLDSSGNVVAEQLTKLVETARAPQEES